MLRQEIALVHQDGYIIFPPCCGKSSDKSRRVLQNNPMPTSNFHGIYRGILQRFISSDEQYVFSNHTDNNPFIKEHSLQTVVRQREFVIFLEGYNQRKNQIFVVFRTDGENQKLVWLWIYSPFSV